MRIAFVANPAIGHDLPLLPPHPPPADAALHDLERLVASHGSGPRDLFTTDGIDMIAGREA